jgi:dipeptidyl aminopeptidase/acylaminoacyl peptidase
MMVKKAVVIILVVVASLFIFCLTYTPPLPQNHGQVDARFFQDTSEKQPLIVAFGGSGGGMLYAQESSREFREKILSMGYALLTIGYIGTENSQSEIDRVSLDAIYDTIKSYQSHPLIDGQKTALLGFSRGGELVLNLAAGYNDFDAVVSIVPPNMTMPYRFNRLGLFETSAWTMNGKEIPCISSSSRIRKILRNDGLHTVLSEILKDDKIAGKAEIPVERMNCPVLIISAKNDEVWPSAEMGDLIIKRLQENNYGYYSKHIVIDGGHSDPYQDYDLIVEFLKEHFKPEEPAADNR